MIAAVHLSSTLLSSGSHLHLLVRVLSLAQFKVACMLACLVLLLAAPVDAQEVQSHLSVDPHVNYGGTLIQEGRFTEALSILRPLASSDHPDQVDALFLVGLAALGAAQIPGTPELQRKGYLGEAIASFHKILVDRPELVRVRLELARAFYVKGDDGLSQKHFKRVLAGNPHPAVAGNIRRFLAVIRERRRWNGYFGAAMVPDSNINASSDTRTINIWGLPFEVDAGSQSGWGVALWGGGEYEHPLSENVRLRAGGHLSLREYEGQDFDQTFLSAHAGPRWFLGNGTEVSLLSSARRQWLGGDGQWRASGLRIEASHRLRSSLLVRTEVSYHQRSHDEDVHLDGPRTNVSLRTLWQATPTVRLEASVGITQERTEQERHRNTGQSLGLDVSADLPRGFTMGVNGESLWTEYEGDWYPFTSPGQSRRDQTGILSISVFNRGFTVQGFSPKLVLTREIRGSNAQLHDYRRTRMELQFIRQL